MLQAPHSAPSVGVFIKGKKFVVLVSDTGPEPWQGLQVHAAMQVVGSFCSAGHLTSGVPLHSS
jgi:hypothetical protein